MSLGAKRGTYEIIINLAAIIMSGETMMSEIDKYIEKYQIDENGKRDMLEILNRSLIMISKGILESREVKVPEVQSISEKNEIKKEEIRCERKKYKSRKAEEYAEEHNLTLEDFEIEEVSKKDVENKVREIAKRTKETKIESKITKVGTRVSTKVVTKEENITEVKKSKEKVICSGINKRGESCKSVGTIQPDGAKRKYCFRHAEDFHSFECDSDSSNTDGEEELEEEEMNKVKKEDNEELEEEEMNKVKKEDNEDKEELEEEELE